MLIVTKSFKNVFNSVKILKILQVDLSYINARLFNLSNINFVMKYTSIVKNFTFLHEFVEIVWNEYNLWQ